MGEWENDFGPAWGGTVRMGNMHRIQWFHQQIREGNYPNSNLLAKRFEISRRQAQRDIEYLEYSLHAPLVYIAGRRGYGYEDNTYELPHLFITEEEMAVLKFLAHRYRNYDYENAAAVRRVAHLLDRFTDGEHVAASSRLPVFEANPSLLHNMGLISEAIRARRVVELTCRQNDRDVRLRIRPIRLDSRYNADYVIAYGERQEEQFRLRLDALRHLVVTKELFEHAETDTWQQNDGSGRNATKPFVAKIQLPRLVDGTSWGGYKARRSDGCVYEIEFYDAESFVQHLFLAEWERLLAPKWLKAMLRGKCLQVLERLPAEERKEDGVLNKLDRV